MNGGCLNLLIFVLKDFILSMPDGLLFFGKQKGKVAGSQFFY